MSLKPGNLIIYILCVLLMACQPNQIDNPIIKATIIQDTESQRSVVPDNKDRPELNQSLIHLKGKIVFPEQFGIKALNASDIIKNATVSVIEPQTKRTLVTTLSDNNGSFAFPPTAFSNNSSYFLDIYKRENTVGTPAIFMRTLFKVSGGSYTTITGNQLIVSPKTTAIAMAALLNQMTNFDDVLNKVSVDGLTFMGDVNSAVPMAKINKVFTKVNDMMTGQADPLKEKPIIVTSLDKTNTVEGDVVTINGLGFDENTLPKLEGATMTVVERTPHYMKVKIVNGQNTGNIKVEDGIRQSDSVPVKVATQINVMSGNFQLVKAGTNLKKQMKIRARDINNDIVPDIKVNLAFTKGDGTLGTTTATTDSNGEVTFDSQVNNLSFNDITATLNGTSISDKFTHIGLATEPGEGNHIFLLTESFSAEARKKYTGEPIRAMVIDDNGNPKANASVRFGFYSSANQNATGDPWLIQFKTLGATNQTFPGYFYDKKTGPDGIVEVTNFYMPYSACSCPHKISVSSLAHGESLKLPTEVTAPTTIVDRLEIVSGNNQSIETGRPFPTQLKVRAIDTNGNVIPNVALNWSFTEGSGTIGYYHSGNGPAITSSNKNLVSGTNGESYINLTAPLTPQTIKVKAETANGEGTPAIFDLTATLSTTNVITLIGPTSAKSVGTGQTTGSATLKVKVTDPLGDPVPNATVNYSIITGCFNSGVAPTALTNASGISSVAFIGQQDITTTPCYGTKVEATSPGAFGTIAFPNIYVTAKPVDTMAISSGDNQTTQVGDFTAQELEVKFFDQYLNRYKHAHVVKFELAVPNTGLINEGSDPVTINGNNTSSVKFQPLVIGPIKVKATLIGGQGTVVEFTVNGFE